MPQVNNGPASPGETKLGGGIFGKVAEKLREKMPNTTEPYVAHGVTLELYNECLKQAEYVDGHELSESARFWYNGLLSPSGLGPEMWGTDSDDSL